jgi:hypothetical protein
MKNFSLHNEQTVNGLRKIAWASVFGLKQQHINIDIIIKINKNKHIHTHTHTHTHEK